MKYIISGTNRPGSNSLKTAHIVKSLYEEQGEEVEIIDIAKVPLQLVDGSQYSKNQPAEMARYVEMTKHADAYHVICPEYNGSMPGALKYFIDHWKYPDSFEFRPVAFVGLGGRFGGLRPVEHLQQVFGYRNAFIYPERVFLIQVEQQLKTGSLQDEFLMGLLRQQVRGFRTFTQALIDTRLHGLHRNPQSN